MILMLFLESELGPDGNASGIHNDSLRILSAYYLPCVNFFNPHNNPVRCMKNPRQRTTWVTCSSSHSQEVADLGFELRTSGYSAPSVLHCTAVLYKPWCFLCRWHRHVSGILVMVSHLSLWISPHPLPMQPQDPFWFRE